MQKKQELKMVEGREGYEMNKEGLGYHINYDVDI